MIDDCFDTQRTDTHLCCRSLNIVNAFSLLKSETNQSLFVVDNDFSQLLTGNFDDTQTFASTRKVVDYILLICYHSWNRNSTVYINCSVCDT